MNPLDVVAVLLIAAGAILGFRSGALPQIGGLIGALGGAAIVVLALPALVDPLSEIDIAVRPFVVLAGLLIAVGIGESIGSTLGRRAAGALGTGVLGAADRVGGSIVGVGQALLIIWLVGGLLALGPMVRLSEAAQTSRAVRALNAVLPAPGDFAAELGRLLDSTGLPAVFVGFEPIPQAPVDVPGDPAARALAADAIASTVKVEAIACGNTSTGTGFAIADGYVVTNAHVVAGARRLAIAVEDATGKAHDATAVMFDPALDVALLRVRDLDVPALRFAVRDPRRGAIGAALGYPGGGRLKILPAAVAGSYPAVGRDIYGEERVRRDILELRSEIERGDSGGPFVLEDGTVGGLVFAEARSDDEVGYALSPTAVSVRIAPSIGRTDSVDTGDCIR